MYILFEMSSPDGVAGLYAFDLMGYTDKEADAQEWVARNPQYRAYRYCPKTKYCPK